MNAVRSTPSDIDQIFELYEVATRFQKTKFSVHWPPFERSMVAQEIAEGRQYKLLDNGQTAAVWALAFSDPLIWKGKDQDRALYIHRIATNPAFRGRQLVKKIVDWAIQYARENNIDYVRMDTVGNNRGLIDYYQRCGFTFLGLDQLEDTDGLPAHYDKAVVSLFEIALSDQPLPDTSLTWNDFQRVEIRVGTVVAAEVFEEARKPAYQMIIDFGALGTRKTSAQITRRYQPDDLIDTQVVAVVNFPPKQIATMMSECLVL